jgi:hypothetical protein
MSVSVSSIRTTLDITPPVTFTKLFVTSAPEPRNRWGLSRFQFTQTTAAARLTHLQASGQPKNLGMFGNYEHTTIPTGLRFQAAPEDFRQINTFTAGSEEIILRSFGAYQVLIWSDSGSGLDGIFTDITAVPQTGRNHTIIRNPVSGLTNSWLGFSSQAPSQDNHNDLETVITLNYPAAQEDVIYIALYTTQTIPSGAPTPSHPDFADSTINVNNHWNELTLSLIVS